MSELLGEEANMCYHVLISRKSEKHKWPAVRLDLTRENLEQQFVRPYLEGKPIVIRGATIPPDDVDSVRITQTEQSSNELRPIVQAETPNGPERHFDSIPCRIAQKGKDVTDEFITEPQGSRGQPDPRFKDDTRIDRTAVFVVFGRNLAARDAMYEFLRAIGLRPIGFNAPNLTGKPSPYIGEILDAAFARAQAILVLMTPDDEGLLRRHFQRPNDPGYEKKLTPQARLNVVFEAGMAMGRDPDRTVLVELGTVRPYSDIAGRHVIRLDNTTQKRQELAQRLEAAGCRIDVSGTEWHNTGDFNPQVQSPPLTGKEVTSTHRKTEDADRKPALPRIHECPACGEIAYPIATPSNATDEQCSVQWYKCTGCHAAYPGRATDDCNNMNT